MHHRIINPLLVLAVVGAGLACGDSTAPLPPAAWEWRLQVPFDSAGPRIDTLNFHWPRSALPVRIWVENGQSLPTRVQEGITLWRNVLGSRDWNASIVTDSTQADIIVRLLPADVFQAVRHSPPQLVCEGSTTVDTAATRFQLQLPIRVNLYPTIPGPGVDACLHSTAAHELGHTLGIFQHSPDPADLMYISATAAGPTARDAATALRAYATPSDMVLVGP